MRNGFSRHPRCWWRVDRVRDGQGGPACLDHVAYATTPSDIQPLHVVEKRHVLEGMFGSAGLNQVADAMKASPVWKSD